MSMIDTYLETAAWSSSDDNGRTLEGMEWSREAKKVAASELDSFCHYLDSLEIDYSMVPDDTLAGDFWLSRNGHGAGFWDRGMGVLGFDLHAAAKSFGSIDVYIGDDNLLHFS